MPVRLSSAPKRWFAIAMQNPSSDDTSEPPTRLTKDATSAPHATSTSHSGYGRFCRRIASSRSRARSSSMRPSTISVTSAWIADNFAKWTDSSRLTRMTVKSLPEGSV